MIIQIPNLDLLRNQIEDNVHADESRTNYFILELLPYSLGATAQALFDFVDAERQLVESTIANSGGTSAIHAVGRGGSDKLSYRIDTFLETARRTQNAIIPYISKVLSISLPMSLSDVVKKINAEKLSLPENLKSILVGYWENQGKTLKNYRDLSQHHALVASEVLIFTSSDGQPTLYMSLPRNPDEKNPAKHNFDDPPVMAFFYMKEQLYWLIRFAYAVATALTSIPEGDVRTISRSVYFRKPLQVGSDVKMVGQHIVSHDDLRKGIDDLISEFAWI